MSNPYSADQRPDLSLAQTPDVTSGSPLQALPVPLPPPIPREQPVLQSANARQDIAQMGIVDNVPYYDLNLAGVNPLPNPPYNAPPGNTINSPTFATQNYQVPPTRPHDLQGPGIDLVAEMQADPQVGDLLQFDDPHGLDITASSSTPMAADKQAPDLNLYDRPENLLLPDTMMIDPTLPDLQHPQLAQQVNSLVDERPADLSAAALSILHSSPTYEQIPADDYEQLWMTQMGNNAARERHLGMLMYGLDREEGHGS
jgi:hypothetical protein